MNSTLAHARRAAHGFGPAAGRGGAAVPRRRDRVAQFGASDPAGLRGKVVIAGFWTYTCINWLRSFPTSAPGPGNTRPTGWW